MFLVVPANSVAPDVIRTRQNHVVERMPLRSCEPVGLNFETANPCRSDRNSCRDCRLCLRGQHAQDVERLIT